MTVSVHGSSKCRLQYLRSIITAHALIFCPPACSKSAENSEPVPAGASAGSEVRADVLGKAEKNVKILLDEYLRAAELAEQRSSNPLQTPAPSLDKLKSSLADHLDPLLGQSIVVNGIVAGFDESEEGVRIAFADRVVFDEADGKLLFDDVNEAPIMRLRLNANDYNSILQQRVFGAQGIEDNHPLGFALAVGIAPALTVHVNIQEFCASGIAGKDIELDAARKLKVGDEFPCRIRVIGWQFKKGGKIGGKLSLILAAEKNELLSDALRKAGMPFIEIECEWDSDAH